ncbi:MAG: hypothetical protein JHC98_06975 [Thermoleophilaceae bacterium]|nr:hypothetical protein [Thermoleophilaceae bacterium]
MPADGRASSASKLRAPAAIALIALATAVSGCGSSDVQENPTSLEKPALSVPEGSVAASSTTKKTGSTGTTSSTTSEDTSSSDTGTDTSGTDTGTDTGGADTGAGTDTGTDTGGADTGGAGPGN